MGEHPSTVEYPPPDYPRADTKQAAYHIGSGRIVRHEKAANDIAADCSGARHRAVDRGDLAMIGGRALGLQQGDRKNVVEGKSVSVRVDLGGRRTNKKQKK